MGRLARKFTVAASASFGLLAMTPICAHDFWIAASPDRAKPGQVVTVTANVGDDSYPVSQFATAADRIESLRLVGATTRDISPAYRKRGQALAIDVPLGTESTTYMAVLAVKPHFLSMQPRAFEDYLREEGLTDVLAERQRLGESDLPSRERYSRQAKTLINAGGAASTAVTRPVGLPAEIVPDTDVTRAHVGSDIGLRVLLAGQPAANAQVSLYSSGPGDIHARRQVVRTSEDGRARFRLTGSGPYLVTSTLMVRRQAEAGTGAADWDSYWVSLTFNAQ